MSFERLLSLWLEHLDGCGQNEKVRDLRLRWLGMFVRWCREQGVESPVGLAPRHLEDFRSRMTWTPCRRGRFYSPNTVDQAMRTVRGCLRWAADQGWLMPDPTRDLVLGKPLQPRQRVLTPEEVERLLETPDPTTPLGMRDRAVLALFYHTTASAETASRLRVEHLQLPWWLTLPGPGGPVRLELDGELARRLDRYLNVGRYDLVRGRESTLFLSCYGRPMTGARLLHVAKATGQAAGLGSDVSPRALRRAFAAHRRSFQSPPALSPN